MKESKRLIIIGASGHGRVCAEIAELSGKYDCILFLDDRPVVKECGKYDVIGSSCDFLQYVNDKTEFFVSIGKFEHRKRIQEKIEDADGLIATLIHPKAVISESVSIGAGSVVMPIAVINSETRVGKGVIINTSASVDHDCIVGDWGHIAVGTHICGTVHIGNDCWIGAGAVVSNNLSICGDVIVGAGATVVKNIEECGTYIGVPAKMMKESGVEPMNNKTSGTNPGGYYLSRTKAFQAVKNWRAA